MPVPSLAISAQDELLRLTGTSGNPFEDVSATGNGVGRYFGANKSFAVRPIVAGTVAGTNPTLDLKLQVSADNVTYTDTGGVSLAQITASSAVATGSLAAPAMYLFNTPTGYPWVRVVKTIGGTASPSFPSFWLAVEAINPY
jgi:hypothetical protein